MSASFIHPTEYAKFESERRTLGEWDPATLSRLAAYLIEHEAEVIVEVDSGTGHAVQGKVTAWKWSTVNSMYPHLQITTEHNVTNYRVSNIGAIVVVGRAGSNAKWDMHHRFYGETGSALSAVRKHIGQDWPDEDPAAGRRAFHTVLRRDDVEVIWGDDTFRAQRWFVRDGEVVKSR